MVLPFTAPLTFLLGWYLRFSIAVKRNDERKRLGWDKVYFAYISRLQSIIERSQGRNLEAGTDVEAMEKCCLLACCPRLSQSIFL